MMHLAEKKYFHDCLPEPMQAPFTDGENRYEIKKLRRAIDFRIATAISCAFYFRAPRELALISGAGIAGLAASFELLARGFKVIIAEKRETFSRYNIINLNVEVQHFLKRFGLLKEFEDVAARITRHEIVHFKGNNYEKLLHNDVSQLRLRNEPFEPDNFDNLFNEDGIYSIKIKDLQNFLAKKALKAGVCILGNVEVNSLTRSKTGGVSKVQVSGQGSYYNSMILKPHLFFVAEGAHSTTADQLEMRTQIVENACTGENWIFGNTGYLGKETFVVSIIDTSEENVKIANVIFNAKINEINIAVTSKEKTLSAKSVKKRILKVVGQPFCVEIMGNAPQDLTNAIAYPVHVINEKRIVFSKGNIFLIGDTAGRSSPLAGLGGTLGLTLVPRTIKQLLDDREVQPHKMHSNFQIFSEAYTSTWIEKSQKVKSFCIGIFQKEKTPKEEFQYAP